MKTRIIGSILVIGILSVLFVLTENDKSVTGPAIQNSGSEPVYGTLKIQ